MGKRPDLIPKNRIITKKEMRHYEYLNSYVNPIIKAREYRELLKKGGLSQNKLAKKLGISRVRITQFLNLLKLPQEQQDYVLRYGKEKLITEKALRKGGFPARGVQKL